MTSFANRAPMPPAALPTPDNAVPRTSLFGLLAWGALLAMLAASWKSLYTAVNTAY